jgi:uncharacterized CHY-type Zn-finger protein
MKSQVKYNGRIRKVHRGSRGGYYVISAGRKVYLKTIKKTIPKKTAPKKKTASKRKTVPKKKPAPKKKTASKRKTVPKKKPAPKRKTAPKKKTTKKQSKSLIRMPRMSNFKKFFGGEILPTEFVKTEPVGINKGGHYTEHFYYCLKEPIVYKNSEVPAIPIGTMVPVRIQNVTRNTAALRVLDNAHKTISKSNVESPTSVFPTNVTRQELFPTANSATTQIMNVPNIPAAAQWDAQRETLTTLEMLKIIGQLTDKKMLDKESSLYLIIRSDDRTTVLYSIPIPYGFLFDNLRLDQQFLRKHSDKTQKWMGKQMTTEQSQSVLNGYKSTNETIGTQGVTNQQFKAFLKKGDYLHSNQNCSESRPQTSVFTKYCSYCRYSMCPKCDPLKTHPLTKAKNNSINKAATVCIACRALLNFTPSAVTFERLPVALQHVVTRHKKLNSMLRAEQLRQRLEDAELARVNSNTKPEKTSSVNTSKAEAKTSAPVSHTNSTTKLESTSYTANRLPEAPGAKTTVSIPPKRRNVRPNTKTQLIHSLGGMQQIRNTLRVKCSGVAAGKNKINTTINSVLRKELERKQKGHNAKTFEEIINEIVKEL